MRRQGTFDTESQEKHNANDVAACVVLLIVGFAITMAVLYANVTLANKRLAGMLGMASDVIATADPENTDRPFTAATAIDMLEAWSDVVHEEMADEPEIRARILNDLGESFIGFDRHGLAQTHLEEAQHTLMDFDSEPDLTDPTIQEWLVSAGGPRAF